MAGLGARGVIDLAEHEEVLLALVVGEAQHVRAKALPELVVHVPHGVDAEAVNVEVLDPALVDVRHALDHSRVLREEVVEAGEVAEEGVFPGIGGVSAVVVHRHVVEPGRVLGCLLALCEHRRVGEGGVGAQGGESVGPRDVAGAEGVAFAVLVGRGVRADVGHPVAAVVADDVRGVVGDDVEVDLEAAVVGCADGVLHRLVAAEVRVDVLEVRDPVAVVAGGLVLCLHGLVGERGSDPDGVNAKALDVVELVLESFEVSALVVARIGGVVAADLRVAAEAAVVIGGIAVVEAVGHDEVEGVAGGSLCSCRGDGVGACVGAGREDASRDACGAEGDHAGGDPCGCSPMSGPCFGRHRSSVFAGECTRLHSGGQRSTGTGGTSTALTFPRGPELPPRL